VLRGIPGVGSFVPSSAEVAAFQTAGEPPEMNGAD